MNVYITDLATFLPNAPVSNQDMEKVLGMVNQIPSRTRNVILRNNRIRARYYAIDPATGAGNPYQCPDDRRSGESPPPL